MIVTLLYFINYIKMKRKEERKRFNYNDLQSQLRQLFRVGEMVCGHISWHADDTHPPAA